MKQDTSERCLGRLPNLFIAGAPKCGTTSLSAYLRTHPDIFVCEPKEPTFWASDMPGLRDDLGFNTFASYSQLFQNCKPEHRYLLDGSTLYLYSDTAIPAIVDAVSDAKFVFAIRNPIEIAHAYHMQMVFYEQDDVADFESAWRLQDARQRGEVSIPKRCLSDRLLQYRHVAAIGTQLERVLRIVPRERVHLVLMDDLKSDAAKVYGEVLRFLELPHDGRSEFGKENSAMRSRNKFVTRMMRTKVVRRVTWWGKQRLPGRCFTIAKKIKNSLSFASAQRAEISVSFYQELSLFFRPEVTRLEAILERDLSSWNHPPEG